MRPPRPCPVCKSASDLGNTVPLHQARAELDAVEPLSREVADLIQILRTRLSPEEFQLVWSLQDAVERLGLAEEILRGRSVADGLAWHLPDCAEAIRTITGHVLTQSETV